jgi:hypothetical protein
MKPALALLLIQFACSSLAQAQSEPGNDSSEWVYEFADGSRMNYQFSVPRVEIRDTPLAPPKVETVGEEGARIFEGSYGTIPKGQIFGVIQRGLGQAHFRAGRGAAITFFTTEKGLYVVTQTGLHSLLVPYSELLLGGTQIHYDPLPEIRLADGRRFRAIALRLPQADGMFTAKIVAFDEQLVMSSSTLENLNTWKGGVQNVFELADNMGGPEVFHLRLEAEGRVVEQYLPAAEWKTPGADDRWKLQATRASIASQVEGFSYYSLRPEARELTPEERQLARSKLSELYQESDQTGAPSRRLVTDEEIEPLISFVNSQIQFGRVGGLIEYLRIKTARSPFVDNWVNESYKIQTLIQSRGVIFLVRRKGRNWVVNHPKGTGAHLQDTLSDCNLTF